MSTTVALITSRLSRVAVFVGLLRLEERQEPRSFDARLQSIEDHAEHGLYNILCRLHVIHSLASATQNGTSGNAARVDLAAGVAAARSAVQLPPLSRPAYRHLRTISIMFDLAQLLQRVIVTLDSVVYSG